MFLQCPDGFKEQKEEWDRWLSEPQKVTGSNVAGYGACLPVQVCNTSGYTVGLIHPDTLRQFIKYPLAKRKILPVA